MSKTITEHVNQAIENIKADRRSAADLLTEGMAHLASKEDHAIIGGNLAKYVETLQRSNEQYVKLIGILAKSEPDEEPRELSDDDRYEFFHGEDKEEEGLDVG